MNLYFEVNDSPNMNQIAEISDATPHSPFNTTDYSAAKIAVGKNPCLFALRSGKRIVSGCIGFLQGGKLSRRLEIVTTPFALDPSVFWSGVRDFCLKHGVWELDVQSFGSDAVHIPLLPNELSRRVRCEFLIDLSCPDPFKYMSKNHKRNIKRAMKSDLTIKRTCEIESAKKHLSLIKSSMQRRRDRGEEILLATEMSFEEALLGNGAAEIFQVADQMGILSSILILRSNSSAYYQSAGTSPEGMKKGASMFLISEVIKILKSEGVSLFNLGGAGPEEEGLQRFKQGFGSKKVMLEAATFSTVSPFKRRLWTGAKFFFHLFRN